MEANEIKTSLRGAISAFCKWRVGKDMCKPDECDFCPVNDVYDMARSTRKAVDIEWDTDDISIDDLPEEVSIEDDIDDDEVADYLSDIYGWCVKGFRLEEA